MTTGVDPNLSPESASVIALPDAAPSESAPSNGVGAAPTSTETPAAPAPGEPAAAVAEEVALEPSLMETFEAEEAKRKAAEAELTGEKPGEEKKPAEAKPEAKPGETPAEGDKAAEAKILEPVEYAYKVPETLKIDDTAKQSLHKALDSFRADPSTGAQALIDLHNERMKAFADETLRNQIRTFNDTRRGWRDQIKADPILGGSGFETAQRAIGRMRTLLVAEKDKGAFDEFLKTTGAGDHPQFHKLLHNAARLYDEPTPPTVTPSPTPNNGAAPGKRTLRDLYKSNS